MASTNLFVGFDALIQDATVGVSNFGTIGVFCSHSLSAVVRTYEPSSAGLAAMLADGFTENDYAYMALFTIMMMEIPTKSVKIYKRAAANVQALTLTPVNLVQGVPYAFKVNNVQASRVNGAAETPTTWCTAWQTILAGVGFTAVNVTSTNGTTFLTLTKTLGTGRRIYLDEIPSYLTVKDTSPDAGIATDLNQALADDSDFYGVVIDSTSEAENNAAAAWCEANKRMFHALTVDSDVLTNSTTDVGSDFAAAKYTYSGVFYTKNASKLWNVGLMGRQFGRDPGRSTWDNKQLPGIPADNLTASEITNAKAKNVCLYLPVRTLNQTHDITAGSGRFFDMTRDKDFFVDSNRAALLSYQAREEKIPANQLGIDAYESVVRGQCEQAERMGIIDPGWTVTFPKAADLPNLKATRRLDAGQQAFFALFQGAIHGIDAGGILAV